MSSTPDEKPSMRRRSNVKGSHNINDSEMQEQKTQNSRTQTKMVHSELSSQSIQPTPELYTYGGIKLGWIQGVLIPCLLNIWGVMLFLRIAWVVAQAGIGLTILIIAVASMVCVITALSLSAICTNGEVQGGGVYYLVSRSLGAELGASVGIIFAFANAVAASMNTIGFCESLNELLKSHGLKIIDNSVNDIRIVGAIALLVMCLICAVGMDWETLTQNFLIILILIAITNYILGSLIGPLSNEERAQGYVGINSRTASDNFLPDFRFSEGEEHNLFSVFAIYFPAVTGVQAGANICGDLRNPAEAIPKGTLTALAVSTGSYLVMAVLAGTGAMRDASGRVSDLLNGTLDACKPTCPHGLHNNYEIMHVMSLWSPLIYGGCWAATLSTALTNLLSVPRLIQALGIDRIYPGLIFFSKPYGKHGEPYRGYVLVFFVSLLFLLIADLNTIAPLITNFYLASYALINFCAFHAGFVKPLSWRPSFRFHNTWVSLVGFLLCLAIMTVTSWMMALVTVAIFLTLYLIVLYRKPMLSWGSSTDAYRYRETVSALLTMTRRPGHVKEYCPRPLVLTGDPAARPALLHLARLITTMGSFMIALDISTESRTQAEKVILKKKVENWLMIQKYRAFYVYVESADLASGVGAALQCAGLGRFTPNIMLAGFKADWTACSHEDLLAYVRIIRNAFEMQTAVCILRMPEAAPAHAALRAAPAPASPVDSVLWRAHSRVLAVMHSTSDYDVRDNHRDDQQETSSPTHSLLPSDSLITVAAPLNQNSPLAEPLILDEKSSIDTWWLCDDGGLTILLSYIMANRALSDKIPLRIFALARSNHKPEDAEQGIKVVLAMFRIEYTSLTLVQGVDDSPSADSRSLFEMLIQSHRSTEYSECLITDEELERLKLKISRNLRLRELIIKNSSKASLIVVTLPIPRKESVSAAMYMAWLEVFSRDMPPMLFVRGNESSVLYA